MKSKFYLLLLICFSFTSLATNAYAGKKAILLLGDSLSASYGMQQNVGWVHLLNQKLAQQQADFTLINASISGETTGGALARVDKLLADQPVDYLVIELGGNDGLRGFPPKLMKNNLLQIIDKAKQNQVNVALMQVQIPPNYGPRYNQLFEQVFVDVAKQADVPLLPFFMTNIAIKPELMQADGIHPTEAAQPIIVDFMAEQLTQLVN